MEKKAQSALEYLMTYGWTLIVVAMVVGTLVFIIQPPNEVSFTSTDNEMLLKDQAIVAGGGEDSVTLAMLNATGGGISVTGILGTGSFANTGGAPITVNNEDPASAPVSVGAGSDILIEGIDAPTSGTVGGGVSITYQKRSGIAKTVSIEGTGSFGGGDGAPSGPTGTPEWQTMTIGAGTSNCSDYFNSSYFCSFASNGTAADFGWAGLGTGPPKWIYGDLGENKYVSAVRANLNSSYVPQTMNIDISDDGSAWSTLKSGWTVSTIDWVETSFTETQGRYVRFYITNCARSYCNMKEFEVKTRT